MKNLQHSVYIKAHPEKIWDILIDVEKWNQWDKDVISSTLQGDFRVGIMGTLVAVDNTSINFFITAIEKPNFYSNYYPFQFFTRLNFTHKIEQYAYKCKVTFLANFSGPLSFYYRWKLKKSIQRVMTNAMNNLVSICESNRN